MTNRQKIAWPALIALAFGAAALAEPTSAPTVVDASDQAKIVENLGKDVVVEGVVDKAAWSSSGKVMNIGFKGVEATKFGAVAFEKSKDRLDKSFMGDAAKDFTGAKIRIRGKIAKYGGKAPAMMDSLQIIVSDPSQVTIVEPASDATTKPSA